MKRISVFRNYEAGEPTCRLYVKNIAKQVEEKVGGCYPPLRHPGADPLPGTDCSTSSVLNGSLFLPKDLKYIYGRYIDASSQPERNMYVDAFWPRLHVWRPSWSRPHTLLLTLVIWPLPP